MKLLVQFDDGERRARVVEVLGNGSRLYYGDGTLYTHVDADGNNLLEYITAMDCALQGADRILLLGTGGGALATQLHNRGVTVTAIDNWATAFEIARRWFHMPDEIECIHADASEFLRTTARQWDAVAIDIFLGMQIPDSVLTSDIGTLLTKRLAPGGLIVWNVADSLQSWHTQWVAKALRIAGFAPTLVSVLEGDVGNTLVVCRTTPPQSR